MQCNDVHRRGQHDCANCDVRDTGNRYKPDRNSNNGQSDMETDGHNKRRRQEAVGDAKRPRGRQEERRQAVTGREGCVACTEMPNGTSVATVRFSSVQTLILPNLELNLRFGSGKCLNLELTCREGHHKRGRYESLFSVTVTCI
jgi:hypothetical protein